jgi:hypothetical protein
LKDVKDLERKHETLRSSSASKSRFAFKRKSGAASTGGTAQSSPAAARQGSIQVTGSAASTSASLSIASRSGVLVTSDDVPDAGTAVSSELTIRDLDGCLVDLRAASRSEAVDKRPSLSAVHVRNVKNTVLLLPDLQSSILLHDVENCLIAINCQQVLALLVFTTSVLTVFPVPHAYLHVHRRRPRDIVQPNHRALLERPVCIKQRGRRDGSHHSRSG